MAVVLAGGQSQRMDGQQHKALNPLVGRPMLAHVLERVSPQVMTMALSVSGKVPALAEFGHATLADSRQSFRGPLAGLVAGLQWAVQEHPGCWLLLCPCDAPFLPPDLVSRLQSAAEQAKTPLAVARYQGHLQPTFSLWSQGLLAALEQSLEQGRGGLMQRVAATSHQAVDWPEQEPSPFFNVNTPQQLAQAQAWLEHGGH